MRTRDQCSIFSTGGKFHPDYGLLLELHALTLVACSYALLIYIYTYIYITLSCQLPLLVSAGLVLQYVVLKNNLAHLICYSTHEELQSSGSAFM